MIAWHLLFPLLHEPKRFNAPAFAVMLVVGLILMGIEIWALEKFDS